MSNSQQFAIQSGRVYAKNAPRCLFIEDSRPYTADYDIYTRWVVVTAVGYSLRVAGRIDAQAPEGAVVEGVTDTPVEEVTGTDTMVTLAPDLDAGTWKLAQRIGSAETVLDTYADATLLEGATPETILRFRGSTVEVILVGVGVVMSAATAVTSGGRVGLFAATAQAATAGAQIDTLSATNAWEADAVLSERFDGAQGANVQTRLSDSGHTWSKHPSYAGDLLLNGGRGESGSGTFAPSDAYSPSTSFHYLSDAEVPAEFDASLVLRARAASRSGKSLTFRAHPTDDTHYRVGYNEAGEWRFVKRVAGVDTVLDSQAVTFTDRFAYLLDIHVREEPSGDVTVWAEADGVEVLRATDASQLADTGLAGVRGTGSAADTTTARMHVAQLTITEPVGDEEGVVLWEGHEAGDLSPFTQAVQVGGKRQYLHYQEPVGGVGTLMGVHARYASAEFSPHEDGGYEARHEVRSGDYAGSNARNRSMFRINEGRHQGWDEWPIFYGFRFKIPSPFAPVPDVNTIFATHNRSLVASPSDPGVEPFSLYVREDLSPMELGLRIRGGWADSPGSSNYQSFREWTLGELILDEWIDVVLFLMQSYDPGVGRVQLWIATEGEAYTEGVKRQPIATTHKARSNYSEIGYYRESGIVHPQVIHTAKWRTGTSFDAVDPRA